ncbi:MAG: protein-glutamate O-methyltransferase CheR [Chitinophagaceae bacterium]|nr:protein-glutamate O-methyltransferase CheR [Anaerolineae bacterium]
MAKAELEDIELQLLIEGIYMHYGYDFREYAPTSLKRRILNFVQAEKLTSISALQDKVLHDPDVMQRLMPAILVHVTQMFRDPSFYLTFRSLIIPILRSYPIIQIWHAGCSTGEEVYSLAILLQEENLYDRCQIYATDINDSVLQKAKSRRVPIELMRDFTRNYVQSGGKSDFSNYYVVKDDVAVFKPELTKNVTFAPHNLVTDGSFKEFNLIFCRNVLIYFNRSLQARVHTLIYESLAVSGTLALGHSETVRFTPHEAHYRSLDPFEKLFRKVR